MHYERGNRMLKMSLKKLRSKIQVHPESWTNIEYTDSYAYALGLDIEEFKICKGAYTPGTISSFINPLKFGDYFPYYKLARSIQNDLKKLNISYRRINPDEELQEGEWKMALFITFYDESHSYYKLSNYKFLRQNPDGVWSYKNGYYAQPINQDSDRKVIEDPRTCHIKYYRYQKCYALKMNEE